MNETAPDTTSEQADNTPPTTPPKTGRPVSYIGVSGVVSTEQQTRLTALATYLGFPANRRLLLGVKAVHKTLVLEVENKYGPAWYPVGGEAFTNALAPAPANNTTLRVAQIYLDIDHVQDPTYRTMFMTKVLNRGSAWLDGLQFDMLPWHTDPTIAGFLADLKTQTGLPIYLQCHGPAMTTLGPEGVTDALTALADDIDYVLFDSSHGTGTRLDVDTLTRFVDATYSTPTLDHLGVAVAGGLSPTTVTEDLATLVSRFPDLSWDAEGSLHPTAPDGTRPLDWPTVTGYLAASTGLLH